MRLQLALDVSDIDEAVDFYSKLFATEPYKRKPGYANFSIADPPLKLVLFENATGGGTINHLGVETETSEQVEAAEARLDESGLDTTGVNETVCCYAGKTETWVTGPDDERWEWYVKTSDTQEFGTDSVAPFKSAVSGRDQGAPQHDHPVERGTHEVGQRNNVKDAGEAIHAHPLTTGSQRPRE